MLLACILIVLVLVSVLCGVDRGLSFKRSVLLMVELCVVSLAVLLLYNTPDPRPVLVLGSVLGIALSCLFSAVQLGIWLSATSSGHSSHLFGIVDTTVLTIGPFAPRLAGASIDPSRGGMLIAAYIFIVLSFGRKSWTNTGFVCLGSLLVLLTVSRSAIVAFVLVGIALLFSNRELGPRRIGAIAIPSCLLIAAVVYLASRSGLSQYISVGQLVAERLSVSEGYSGGMHFAVIQRGLDISDRSVKNLLFGIGFGNAYTVLGDFYRGSKYGNFHSAYITFLAESGVGALVVFIFLCAFPLFKRRRYVPLMLGMVWFNLFYQLTLEPMFWFSLALSWLNIGFSRAGGKANYSVCERGP
jgi:hypothetical protein